YLELKAQQMEAEEKQNALFDKKLAEEEAWIRQGIKARRTRNEGRVRALKALREESKARRSQQGKVSMATQEANRSGKLVFDIEHLSVS
ncbi:ABC transporter ATP-binding protein, partial [Acinetobacter baumannii]